MWLSNPATGMLMGPIGTAVIVACGPVDEAGDLSLEEDVESELVTGIRAAPDQRPVSDFGLAVLVHEVLTPRRSDHLLTYVPPRYRETDS